MREVPYSLGLVWLRRDLRLNDNAALFAACAQSRRVCVAFVVDRSLLAQRRMGTPIVTFFFDALANLRAALRALGSDLVLVEGGALEEIPRLARRMGAAAAFFNEDYEPYAIERDRRVAAALEAAGIGVHAARDHVYFGADEVTRPDGGAYRVFTPYKRRWLDRRAVAPRLPFPSANALRGKLLPRDAVDAAGEIPTPQGFGFERFALAQTASEAAAWSQLEEFLDERIERYRIDRNVPAIDGTSRLSAHLRAGTIGIRTCVEAAFARRRDLRGEAADGVDAWISELIWRDFYQMIYKTFPHVAGEPFLPAGRRIAWNDPAFAFDAWREGRTGYPLVDAAMRQLLSEGWMHNRLRMIAASFLSKHLLIDWRLGERHFERYLTDADAAQNNGGWQWAASTGTDAAPYFRIFNPAAQRKQFDPDDTFVRRYVPELDSASYPRPIVDHATARQRAIAAYTSAFKAPATSSG